MAKAPETVPIIRDFKQHLLAHRLAAGLSQAALARRAGGGHSWISELEGDGRQNLTVVSLGKLATALGVSPEVLVRPIPTVPSDPA